ncbi:polyamine aminopropyltransferase [Romeria aff. gracilis LEGE 07310]|uniref:S-adenosylmethionine decarboxylase proenzyme n=1 Tax=Vasconcelosia minhoensis LEGE 07310 TaxID=915328 RepID=A0A8J7AEN6_9CYAN|nr:polyamine aminopropyltransferase [Romeria gracilis]MBE9078206.1 polyamine aminopropyltransferase [Romeria aff. gracilis LEGE 07310]
MKSLGRHILVEFHGCSAEILNDVPRIESSMLDAAKEAGATIISSVFHHFSPFGVSGVVVIQESHLAIHTWPEYRYAAVDLFTCGYSVSPWVSYESLKAAFQAEHGSAIELNRGQLELLEKSDIDLGDLRDQATQKLMPPKISRSVWFTDKNENIALSIRHKGDRIFQERSPYQLVEIFDTFKYGKMLTVDKMVMCSEKDEKAYHEMIIHVPLLTNPGVREVLVIGGGDGGSVREILRHPQVEKVTMVEIDEVVVRASRQFLPSLSSSLDDPKLELKIADGIDYVREAADESFDMVVVDSSDPVGPSEGLFNPSFYKDVYRCLRPGGVMTAQSESPRFNQEAFVDLNHCLKGIFQPDSVHCYLAFIQTYPTGMWSFTYCSKDGTHPLQDFDPVTAAEFSAQHDLQYYNSGIHQAAFCLPTFIQTMLNVQQSAQ